MLVNSIQARSSRCGSISRRHSSVGRSHRFLVQRAHCAAGTASARPATDGEQITGQQQSPGAQQPEQASQTVAQPVLAEVDTNSQNHTARLGKRPAPPPSHEPRLKQRKLNAAAEDEQEQLGGSEDPSPAGQHATRPMSAGEGKQGEQAVGRHVGEQGEAAAQAAPAVPSGSMPTGNSLPHAVCICCGSIVTGSSVSCQCMLAHRTRVQAHLVGTWQERLAGTPVYYHCYYCHRLPGLTSARARVF